MGQESDRMLRELVEKEDIRDLVHRYCWAVDRAELEDVMALFHDSCDLISLALRADAEKVVLQSSAGMDAICATASGSCGT